MGSDSTTWGHLEVNGRESDQAAYVLFCVLGGKSRETDNEDNRHGDRIRPWHKNDRQPGQGESTSRVCDRQILTLYISIYMYIYVYIYIYLS